MANLILTMAGKYSRFRNEGYKIPKYLLPWKDGSILNELLHEMHSSSVFDDVFLVANKADSDYAAHIKAVMKHHNISTKNLVWLSDTKGQAETAFLGLQEIGKHTKLNGSIVFHNIDTLVYNRNYADICHSLANNEGHIDIFKSNNHEYSYVLTKGTKVEAIGEKILISDLATSGLYGFSLAETFTDNYAGEGYISEVYKKMLVEGSNICVGKTHSERDTIVLGTPDEYLRHSRALYV
jgi:hypothetical protein